MTSGFVAPISQARHSIIHDDKGKEVGKIIDMGQAEIKQIYL